MRITAMEGMRGYAALIVFCVHVALIASPVLAVDLANPTGAGWLLEWLYCSGHGVDIFFLLSGYLIVGLANKPDFRYISYVGHRVIRIYPALLAMLAVCVVALVVMRHESVSLSRIVGNVFLLNGAFGLSDVQPINYVTWSVFFEFCFYLSFPLLYRRFGFLITALISIGVVIALTDQVDGRYIRFIMFYAGVALKLNPPTNRKLPDWIIAAMFLSVTTASLLVHSIVIFILALAPVAFLLADRALHTQGIINRVFSLKPLRMFGNVSYSFYLLHPIALLAGRYAIQPLHLSGLAWVITMALVGFIFALAMAAGSFYCFERPYFIYRQRAEIRRRQEEWLAMCKKDPDIIVWKA